MRVAPIIHTRTYSCDFNSEFRVRPAIFLDSDIKWARKIVLEATSSIDALQGERWLIADNGKYRIAGVVGFIKNICAHCNLPDEQYRSAEEMFCDDKGRLVYGFIGVVIDTKSTELNSMISYDYLWSMFFDTIQPVWKRSYQEVITTDFSTLNSEVDGIKPNIESKRVGVQEMYESNPIMDYNLFSYYLCNNKMNNFSFCSNISDINAVKNNNFSILTTSYNIITRLNRENITPVAPHETGYSTIENNNNGSIVSEPRDSKKKSFLVSVICLLIFVAIILILLLLTGNSSQASQLVSSINVCQEPITILNAAGFMF